MSMLGQLTCCLYFAQLLKTIDKEGSTALMCAAMSGCNVIPFLVDSGADVNIQDSQGMTALMHACSKVGN
jgi:ankyrin repeat protein